MAKKTAPRPIYAAACKLPARLLSIVSKLKSGVMNSIGRHHRRAVSLRVHRASREDGGIGPAAAGGGDQRTRPNPFARIARRVRALYAAHVARLHALRVYDRTRG